MDIFNKYMGDVNLTTEKKKRVIIDVLFIGIVLLLIYFFMKYLAIWTLPFIIGLIVAIILQSPVNFLTAKTKIPRAVWSILLVLLVLIVLFALIGLVIWKLIQEADGFADWLLGLVPDIKHTFSEISSWFSNVSASLPDEVGSAMQNAPGTVIEGVVGGLAGIATSFAEGFITQGTGVLVSVIFSVVASCYITKDYPKISKFVVAQLSERKANIVINAKRLFVTNILKMLRGYIIIMFITFTELFIGLSILRVKYALVIAIVIAVFDILPVVGTGAILIPWGIIAMLMGNFVLGIGLIILYLAVIIIRNIIEPRIIGQQVGLPPIVTLIAMYVGLKTFGVIGMMLFPVTVIILVKLQEGGIIHLWNPIDKENNSGKRRLFFRKKTVTQKAGSDEGASENN